MKKAISVLALLVFVSAVSVSLTIRNTEGAPEEKSITLKDAVTFSYCCIHHKGPFTEIEKIIMKLMQAIQEQKITPAGPMIGVYYNSPDAVKAEDLEWEIGFPVAPQVSVRSPLEKKQWRYTLVASAVHTGPYEETGQTILKVMEWMQDNELVPSGPVMERYLTMPGPNTKPEDLKSEIWIPCRQK